MIERRALPMLPPDDSSAPLPAEVFVVCCQQVPGKMAAHFVDDHRHQAMQHALDCSGLESAESFRPFRVARYALADFVTRSGHPEDFCERCHRPNVTWFAPSDLWNKAAGDRHDILCPVCFVQLAEAYGIRPTAWKVAPEEHEPSLAQSISDASVGVDPRDLLEVLSVFAKANWPDTKAGNAAFRIVNKLGEQWTQFRDGTLTDTLNKKAPE